MEYTNSQVREAIEEHCHSARNRIILRLRLIDGLTIERIAEEVSMSPRQVRTIIHREEANIFKHL